MAPKSKSRISEIDDYDSDDVQQQPKRKKARMEKEKEKNIEKKSKSSSKRTSTATVPGGGARDEEGSEYWELSKNRRVTISEFKGKRMVHVREYYSKDDKMLPGKKGISLPMEQFSALIETLPYIEMVLAEEYGEELPRPQYDGDEFPMGESKRNAKAEEAEDDNKKKRKNFEATSDEGEDDD
ncbi:MAG: hypothetical protein M1823_002447 [Watsoniomyces obsoletus]|nr:MAG: hypothetical protein M1823_002447 [Watsoniomyces obsoletus]